VNGTVVGRGLHSGVVSSVRFVRHAGPVVLRSAGVDVAMTELRVVETTRSTTVSDALGTFRIGTVEHVLAALGGLGIHEGVAVVIEGREPPLADGGARLYAAQLAALAAPVSAPELHVVRDGSIAVGASTYELRRGDGIELEVEIDFADARIAKSARWTGDPADFVERIASARTFGFEHEVAELLARGLASHVVPESVVVIGPSRILASGRPFTADEPARHKLLDLIGDLYLYGGPPRGHLRAVRPGHAATHTILRRAFEEGLVARK